MKVGKFLVSMLAAVALLAVSAVSTGSRGGEASPGTRGSDTTGSWEEFRGNLNNTGYSTSVVPPSNVTFLKFVTDWSFHSSPVLSGDMLYFGSDSGKIHAVNIATGKEIWNHSTGSSAWASPLVVGDAVFIGSMDGNMYALDKMDGSLRWYFAANDSIVSSAKYANGVVVFGSHDGNVYFVDGNTGLQVIPPFVTGGQIWDTPAIVNDTAIIGSNDGNVYRLYLSNATKMWNFTLSSAPSGFVKYSSPAVEGGRVFIGSDDHYAYAIDLETGNLVWKFQSGNFIYSSPGVHGGRVFVHSTDGNLYALPFDDPDHDGNISTGEVIWQFHTGDGGGGEGGSSPAIADGKVLVAARNGDFFIINETTGQVNWSYSVAIANRPSFSSPAVVDGRVFVGLSDGTMYGFSPVMPGMRPRIQPAQTIIESQRAMYIVFNVTFGGLPVEGAFLTFSVSSGILEQYTASTFPDGTQRIKYLAPKVTTNTTVRIDVTATKSGLADSRATIFIYVVPAQDYGTASGTGFSWDKYAVLLVIVTVLVVVNVVTYAAILVRRRRLPR